MSVIVPVYRVEAHLRACLDSVVGQTYRDLEIILVDDGSPDGCGAICDEYAARDSRVTVIHQENRGLSAARNTGLRRATGSFISFIDPDDWVDPDFHERLVRCASDTGADIVAVGFDHVYRDGQERWGTYIGEASFDGVGALRALGEGSINHAVWNKLYRAELFRDLAFREGKTFEDVLITWQLFLRSHRIVCIDAYLYHQRARASSICHDSASVADNFLSHQEVLFKLEEMEGRGELPQGEGIVEHFFGTTALLAYQTLVPHRTVCRACRPHAYREARAFWSARAQELECVARQNMQLRLALKAPWLLSFAYGVKERFPRLWRLARIACGRLPVGALFE